MGKIQVCLADDKSNSRFIVYIKSDDDAEECGQISYTADTKLDALKLAKVLLVEQRGKLEKFLGGVHFKRILDKTQALEQRIEKGRVHGELARKS